MKKYLTNKQEEQVRKLFADVLYNLSLHENDNSNDLTEEKQAYYRGIIVTSVQIIMRQYNLGWYSTMLVLNYILPTDHVNLHGILPESWHDCLLTSGYINVEYCQKAINS